MSSYLLVDSDILFVLLSTHPTLSNLQAHIQSLLAMQSAWFVPFLGLARFEDLLVLSFEEGELSREELEDLRETVGELPDDLILFAGESVSRRYVDSIRDAVRSRREVTGYGVWASSLIQAVRDQRPAAEVRLLTMSAHLVRTMPQEDVLFLDEETF